MEIITKWSRQKQHTNLHGLPKAGYVHRATADLHYKEKNNHKCLWALIPHKPKTRLQPRE